MPEQLSASASAKDIDKSRVCVCVCVCVIFLCASVNTLFSSGACGRVQQYMVPCGICYAMYIDDSGCMHCMSVSGLARGSSTNIS